LPRCAQNWSITRSSAATAPNGAELTLQLAKTQTHAFLLINS
jgi:hypothetical protein